MQRAMLHWAMGRMLVAAARDASDPEPLLREAATAAAKLAREEVDYARVWSLLVLAAVEDRRQRPERAADLLLEAQLVAERNALLHHAHAARWRLGGIVGGDEGRVLRERARAWSEKESVARFDKMVEVWAPGFRA